MIESLGYDSSGIPRGYCVSRNVGNYNRSGGDYGAWTDSYAAQDYRAVADPDIACDLDRSAEPIWVVPHPVRLRNDLVLRDIVIASADYADTVRNEHVVTYRSVYFNRATLADVDVAPDDESARCP
jgi:hypothetical protein